MKRPEQGSKEIFSDLKKKALGSLDSKAVLERSVQVYAIKCANNAKGPLRESETLKKRWAELTTELGKVEAKLSARPNVAELEQKVSELRRRTAQANRDYQSAYRCSREWVETGEGIQKLLIQELGG